MRGLIYQAMRLPNQPIRFRAENLLRFAPERDELAEVRSLYTYVQNHFHFVNDPFDIELIKSPEVMDAEIEKSGVFVGDCDDASIYLAALLKSAGYAPSFVVAAPEDTGSYDLSH